MEKISVIITCYNREEFVAKAIQSVLNSDFKDFEIIVVDDCSSDKSWDIIESFRVLDCRVKTHRNSVNLGDYKNRNFAISLCSFQLIKFVDSDDELYDFSLGLFYKAYLAYPTAGMYISSRYPEFQNKKFPIELSPVETFRLHFVDYGILDVGPLSVLFKKDVLIAMGCFSGKRYVGDTELLLKIGSLKNTIILNSSMVYWRQHSGQEIKAEALVFDREILSYSIYKTALLGPTSPLNRDLSTQILRNYKRKILISVLKKSYKTMNYFQGIKVFFKVLNEG